jgi:hypothetical protein
MAQYLFGQSSDGSLGKSKGSFFIIGRVKSIVLGPENYDGSLNDDYKTPSDIGKIRYEIMYTNINISNANNMTQPAYPIFSFIKQYPVVSEIVYIVPGPDSDLNDSINRQGYYYFPPYNLWNSTNHNAFPNLQEYSEYLKNQYTKPEYQGSNKNNEVPDLPMGYTFSENSNVKEIRAFEGDSIIESRFGQSIRFGSTTINSKKLNNWSNSGDAGSPILIIKNGQGNILNKDSFSTIVEDLNRDNASIYMTSGQELNINNLGDFPLNSFYNYSKVIARDSGSYPVYKNDNNLSNSKLSKSPVEQDA